MNGLPTIDPVSTRPVAAPIQVLDFEPAVADIRAEVLAGLSQPQKSLPCKLFYDEIGSRLFDEICRVPEYYPTRTELSIMQDSAAEMATALGPRPLIVEYGSGSSLKTRLLLDALPEARGYVPIDISSEHLLRAAQALGSAYPHLTVQPVCADYTRPFTLPPLPREPGDRVVAYFPGSTVGNFDPEQAVAFLESMRATCGPGSGLLIGVDLKKDPAVLHAAYNDAAGVTAAFNLNLLRRLNRDLGADFDPAAFFHYAFYQPMFGRMEMHLISRRVQTIDLGGGQRVQFDEGESIHTESSYKYTLQGFRALAARAAYRHVQTWTDPRQWFGLLYFTADA